MMQRPYKSIVINILFIFLLCTSTLFAGEIVVDNTNVGFNVYGSWQTETNSPDKYGSDYRYADATADYSIATAYAIWQPTLPTSTSYQVYIWYPESGNHVSDAQYYVYHDAGVSIFYSNQTIHGGQWNLLGTFRFSAGTSGYVKVTNYSVSTGKAVVADAVKFVSYSPPATKSGGEFRAYWVYSWRDSMLTPTQCTAMIDTARRFNYNAVLPEVRKIGDAYYKSTYEPWASNITPANHDILSTIIQYAHDTSDGKPYIEVHAWMVTYRDWVIGVDTTPAFIHHVYWTHPEWFTQTYTGITADGPGGTTGGMFLDPALPEVEDYLTKIYLDVIKHYQVDGIHYDYVRYPEANLSTGSKFGYNSIVSKRFQQEYGYAPPTTSSNWAHWTTWCQYRRDGILALVKKVYAHAMEINPNIKVTGSFATWLPFNPVFTQSRPYYDALCDWVGIMKEHTLDASVPMDYLREHVSAQSTGFRGWAQLAVDNSYGRHTYIGTGSYLNDTANNLTQMSFIRNNAHAQGIVNYAYNDMNSTKFVAPAIVFTQISTQLYSTATNTPGMLWKSEPTTGILKGHVYSSAVKPMPYYNGKVVYRARVVAKNESTLSAWTTTTDGTGFYAFIDLLPGNYSITAYPPKSYRARFVQKGNPIFAGLVTTADCKFMNKRFGLY